MSIPCWLSLARPAAVRVSHPVTQVPGIQGGSKTRTGSFFLPCTSLFSLPGFFCARVPSLCLMRLDYPGTRQVGSHKNAPRPWLLPILPAPHFFFASCSNELSPPELAPLVSLVASSPSRRSCRRFLDLWLNRARGIPTEALLKFRAEARLRCRHFCSRVQ